MSVTIEPVGSKKQKKLFFDLEWQLNHELPNWISPLRLDRKEILDPVKNPFFEHAEARLFLAMQNGKAVGRIVALINRNHNRFHGDKAGFWGFFESIRDQEVADALFRSAAAWLRDRDMTHMYGPMNPSTNDEVGLLIEGHDTPPYVMMPHTQPYYHGLVEHAGNTKAMDLLAWFITSEMAKKGITDKMVRVSDKIKQKYGITLRNLKMKALNTEIRIIQEIYNNAWSDNWGFVPFTDNEIDHVAAKLKQFAREELILIAMKDDVPIGFSVTIPNINEALARVPSGKLLPTGIFKLLYGMRKIRSLRVLILGVKKKYQFIGLGSIFYMETIRRAMEMGYTHGEMSWILENNHTMNRAIEAIGSECYKKYRVYSYTL